MKVFIEFLRLKVVEIGTFILALICALIILVPSGIILIFTLGCFVSCFINNLAYSKFIDINRGAFEYEFALGAITMLVLVLGGFAIYAVVMLWREGVWSWVAGNWEQAKLNIEEINETLS